MNGVVRLLTCGSVDDGKSTLIGRLLYDSKAVLNDQLEAAKNESKKYGTTDNEIDLALLIDGLQSEREQGITIDVAYRFFSTKKKKFIIADTPGHEQYTRNMVTGASNSEVAIILIDARKGVLPQTKRHSYIVNLLGIKHIIVAINKMDLVNYSQEQFEIIKKAYMQEILNKLPYKTNLHFIPISALKGDNIVYNSKNMDWYKDEPLLSYLENLDLSESIYLNKPFRFPVQYVNRPNLNFRGYCGTVISGSIKVGDEIAVLPSGKKTRIKHIINAADIKENNKEVYSNFASASMAVTIITEDELDISRGDMIVSVKDIPTLSNHIKVFLVWLNEKPMRLNEKYKIKQNSAVYTAYFEKINYKIDINNITKEQVDILKLNDIGSCRMVTNRPIIVDKYLEKRLTGSFIVIDPITNNTVGAGMIVNVSRRNTEPIKRVYTPAEKALNAYIREHFPEWDCKAI